MWTKRFWAQALERCIKTFAQTLLATLGAAAALESVDWTLALTGAGLAALLSVLTSVGSLVASPAGSPSLVDVDTR